MRDTRRLEDVDEEAGWAEDAGLAGLALLALAAFALAVIGLFGCQPQGKAAGESFLDEVRAFNDGVRWDRRDEVLDRLPAKARKDYLDQEEETADDLHIDDWELDRADFNGGKGSAEVRLHYMWHREREMIMNTTYVTEQWKRQDGRWVMSGVSTRKGSPLPVFAPPERAAGEHAEP
jgi:hypothetical protein